MINQWAPHIMNNIIVIVPNTSCATSAKCNKASKSAPGTKGCNQSIRMERPSTWRHMPYIGMVAKVKGCHNVLCNELAVNKYILCDERNLLKKRAIYFDIWVKLLNDQQGTSVKVGSLVDMWLFHVGQITKWGRSHGFTNKIWERNLQQLGKVCKRHNQVPLRRV